MADKEIKRTNKGTFAKGQSGNPAGRPRTESAKLRAAIAEHGEEVAAVVVDAALAGDMSAAKMVLDRILPPLKAQTEQARMDGPLPETIGELAEMFTKATADGSLPLEVGLRILDAIEALPKLLEASDKEERRQKWKAEGDYMDDLLSIHS